MRLKDYEVDGTLFLPNVTLPNVDDEWVRIALLLGFYLDLGASLSRCHFCDDGMLLMLPSRPVTILNLSEEPDVG